ncbi:hypothetical protein [Parasphingorhabdus sp.]|uniref:hypothetical protein n=1 Tax=Parasphingorhabdus sp. TaxID=2709688 RepID=UPI003593C57F
MKKFTLSIAAAIFAVSAPAPAFAANHAGGHDGHECEKMEDGKMKCCKKDKDGKMACQMMTGDKMDHSKVDHSKVDHGKMDHSKMDHSKMDHSKMDHSKMDHGNMASPAAPDQKPD